MQSIKKALAFVLLAAAAQTASAVDLSNNYGAILGKYVYPDDKRDAEYGAGVHLIYGIPLLESLDLEPNAFFYGTRRETSNDTDYGYGGGLDLRYALADSRSFGLFFLIGVGGLVEDLATETGVSPYADAGFSLNFWNILNIPNLSLRTDVRFYGVDRKDSSGYANPALRAENLGDGHANIGFQLDFAKPEQKVAGLKDSDGDGVIDGRDECPGTPAGTAIDGRGCPLPADTDGDGVVDPNDRCAGTPAGTAVDSTGCPIPVPAPAPLAIAPPADTDGDGVVDAMDSCPNTPAGAQVDVRGCPIPRDLDGDGVPNELDACPNTPLTMKVDIRGCVVKQVVVFHNINFELNSDKLTANAKSILDGVASGLKGQPGMQVEISGHTDSIGTNEYNLKLSQKRATSVKAYLMSKGILANRMSTQGFGEFNPVATNVNEAGRAQNRRVEFKITKQ